MADRKGRLGLQALYSSFRKELSRRLPLRRRPGVAGLWRADAVVSLEKVEGGGCHQGADYGQGEAESYRLEHRGSFGGNCEGEADADCEYRETDEAEVAVAFDQAASAIMDLRRGYCFEWNRLAKRTPAEWESWLNGGLRRLEFDLRLIRRGSLSWN